MSFDRVRHAAGGCDGAYTWNHAGVGAVVEGVVAFVGRGTAVLRISSTVRFALADELAGLRSPFVLSGCCMKWGVLQGMVHPFPCRIYSGVSVSLLLRSLDVLALV